MSARSGSLRRMLRGTAALLAAALLAGCASIPLGGEVHEGDPVESGTALGFDFRPQAPEQGASPVDILTGFIAAGAGPQDNYDVARQFLSRDYARQWNPNSGVLIYTRSTTTVPESSDALRLVVPATGMLDGSGSYEEFASAVPTELSFAFTQEDGEWRISRAPDGLVLPRAFFERLFAKRYLYFFSPGYRSIVPDLRWFPTTADAPTRIVEALLAGPAAPLASPVLVSAFPQGTGLARQSVTAVDGEAIVELNDAVIGMDELAQRRMQLQLTRSLVGGSIVSVAMSVDGQVIDVDQSTGGSSVTQPLVDPRALVVRDGILGFNDPDGLAAVPELGEAVGALASAAVTYSAQLGIAAALTADGVVAARAGEAPVPVDARAGLIAPGLDASGYVWTVPADQPTAVLATLPGGAQTPVDAGGIADATRIVSLEVSRDSTRLLVLAETTSGPRLRVYGIVRDDAGAPSAISTDAFELVPPGGSPREATWVSDVSVASLGDDGDGVSTVQVQDVGGSRGDAISGISDAAVLVGGNGLSSLRVLTSSGTLLVLRGSAWQTVATDVAVLARQR